MIPSPFRRVLQLLVLALLAMPALLVATGTFGSTSASFSDRATSPGNPLGAATLTAPTLSASASGLTANLNWNNPDSLASPAFFQLERAAGTCASPGSFAAITGSPFAITTLATSNTLPGAGTYCFRVRTVLSNWVSPYGTAETSAAGPSQLALGNGAASGSCLSDNVFAASGIAGTSVNVANGTSVEWIGPAGLSLTTLAAGNHSLTVNRLSNSGTTAAANITVTLGTCNTTTNSFSALGSVSISFSGGAGTQVAVIPVASSATLTSTNQLMLRITNTSPGNATKDVLVATDGTSFLTPPSGTY